MQLLPCSKFYSVDLYIYPYVTDTQSWLFLFCSSFEFWKYKSSNFVRTLLELFVQTSNFVLFSPQDAFGYSRPYIAIQI